jgi:hypothetical protein
VKITETEDKIELTGILKEKLMQTLTFSFIACVMTIYSYFSQTPDQRNPNYLIVLVFFLAWPVKDYIASKIFRVTFEPNRFSIRSFFGTTVSDRTRVEAIFILQRFAKNSGDLATVLFLQNGRGTRVTFENIETAERFLQKAKSLYPRLDIDDRREQKLSEEL